MAVEADRLARSGGARHQQMRHGRKIGHHRAAADILAEDQRQVACLAVELVARDQLPTAARISRRALGSSMPITVRPGMLATRADSADMLRAMSSASATTRPALMPGAGSSSSARGHDRPGRTSRDLALDVEILEHRLQQAGIALQRGLVDRRPLRCRHGREQVQPASL